MEDLNKTQLILLTLLVSFVTSIATGIITVSLLQEAPAEITQTINRVVERTVEQVTPETGNNSGGTKEVTVVVKEEDRVIDAISKNSGSIVRINSSDESVAIFLGVLINKDGLVVTDRPNNLSTSGTYRARVSDGTSYDLKLLAYDDESNLAFFQIIKPTLTALPVQPATLSQTDSQLGQTVISIEGADRNIVGIGRVIGLPTKNIDGKDVIIGIESDTAAKALTFGGPLINLSGDVVGIHISKSSVNQHLFVSIVEINQAMTRHSI
jgi:S1-C subfamily serine protease